MRRRSTSFALIAAGLIAAAGARAAPVTQDDFLLATTANLVSLCGAASADALYTPAQNFCQGFVVGTFRVVSAEESASRARHKLFCLPQNPPSRDQAVAAFVQWAAARPKTLESVPTDGLVEYFETAFPCK
nr:Rap1a/Tai family immunity protein [uncultured Rhodopila sp.]